MPQRYDECELGIQGPDFEARLKQGIFKFGGRK
jgi:hypothetical protein